MIRSLYIAGTGMLAQRAGMDVVTNNLVNADTVGYKADQMVYRSFADMMLERMNDPDNPAGTQVGPLSAGVHADTTKTDYGQGPLETTGENTDLAIAGNGYFVLDTPQGERYTRAGNFSVTAEGDLINPDGYYVQGDGGRINVGTEQFTVDALGNITAGEKTVGKIKIVQFENEDNLVKQGDNLFAGQGAQDADEGYTLRQGVIEQSNLNLAREVAQMITTNRAFEMNQRMVKMLDESLGKTVNEIAKF